MASRSLRILHLVCSSKLAGSERYLLTLGRIQRQRGHTVFAAIEGGGSLQRVCVGEGFDILPIDLRWPLVVIRLARFIREENIDIVHTHLTGAARLAEKLHIKTGVKVVAHLHIAREHSVFERIARFGALIGVSESIANFYREQISNAEIQVVLNSSLMHESQSALRPRVEVCQELRSQYGIQPEASLIAMIGRISQGKGQDVLIKALSLLKERGKEVIVACAGVEKRRSGFLRRYQKLADELGVASQVIWMGFQSDTVPLMRAADIVCVPSRFDILPLVVLEGMMLETPIVASAVGGIPEVLGSDERARLVAAENPTALADAIEQLLNNPEEAKAMARRAYEYAQLHLSPTAMADKIDRIYAELIASGELKSVVNG
jgi:glycosyltransferase involved in cell wall biosynthesis